MGSKLPSLAWAALLAAAVAIAASRGHATHMQLALAALSNSLSSASIESIGKTFNSLSVERFLHGVRTLWEIFGPGGRLHPGWFLEHKGHLVIEAIMVVVIIRLVLQQSFKPKQDQEEEPLTDKEIDQLVEEWQPEPLVPPLSASDAAWPAAPVIESQENPHHVVVAGRTALNLACSDFLAMGSMPEVQAVGRATVEKYGVGSCGPRGFYGTFDVHLQLEAALAAFMGTQEAIIYSYDISTVASVIPAFASRPDILVVDSGVAFPIQQGATLSRARVHWFRHNDMDHLESLLQEVEAEERRAGTPLCRKMIVVEGVYANSGDVAPLSRLYQLKERFKYRLCVEESHALGVLGPHRRGACDAAGLAPGQVEIICASMGTALGSVGGFCVGDHEVCDHQRLCGQGYCFSASLPPYLAAAAQEALRLVGGELGARRAAVLRAHAAALRAQLAGARCCGLRVVGGAEGPGAQSPLLHVRLAGSGGGGEGSGAGRAAAVAKLQQIADRLLHKHGLLVTVSRYSQLDRSPPPPSLKLYLTADLTEEQVSDIGTAIQEAGTHVLLGSA